MANDDDNDNTNQIKIGARMVRDLRVPLTQEEVDTRTEQLLELLNKVDHVREEQKRVASHARSTIKEMEQEAGQLRRDLYDRSELRPIDCEERWIYRTGVVQVVRTDTGKAVDERPMTTDERQEQLFADEQQALGSRLDKLAQEAAADDEGDVDGDGALDDWSGGMPDDDPNDPALDQPGAH